MLSTGISRWFCGKIPADNAAVVDMALPLMGDDYVRVELDTHNHFEQREAALRVLMMALLGPRAINEAKFSRWEPQLTVIGQELNALEGTVSIPEARLRKLSPACTRLWSPTQQLNIS
ncbi:hypothetical protein ON010_g13574 [Phytophthora cinnamomi]|nr:hypothetical protein ON010_g13574 [Phytophthora cinnamomi]